MASDRLRNFNSNEGETLAIDMSPMIDMVFLLLIFFVVNSRAVTQIADGEVKVSIADNSEKAESINGRILINIREDGTILKEGGEILKEDDEISEHVRERLEIATNQGYKELVCVGLRGDAKSLFKHSRRVMRLAAAEGVVNVKFQTNLK